jgi:hypothetical protein
MGKETWFRIVKGIVTPDHSNADDRVEIQDEYVCCVERLCTCTV